MGCLRPDGRRRGEAEALTSLAGVDDLAVLPLLIAATGDPQPKVRTRAEYVLRRVLSRAPPHQVRLDAGATDEEVGEAVKDWRVWWRDKRDLSDYRRAAALVEY